MNHRGRDHRSRVLLVTVLVAGALVAVACTTTVTGRGRPAAVAGVSAAPPSSKLPRPTVSVSVPVPSLPSASGSSPVLPIAPCPTIVDQRAGLSFGCLVPQMRIYSGIPYLTQVLAQTESSPDWFMSEYTARVPMADATLRALAGAALTAFSQDSYPPNSPVSVVSRVATTVAGRPAYRLDARIKANKSVDQYRSLKAVADRAVIVVIARDDGTASELILAVPDTRQDLWPRMDAIVAALKLV